MFSSGILTFGEDGDAGFGPQLGDWKVRSAGLKLYLMVCFPLMALTLCAAYGFAKIRGGDVAFNTSTVTQNPSGKMIDAAEKV